MDRCDDGVRPFRFHRHAAFLHHAERGAQKGLRGRGAKAEDDARANDRDFIGEPREAGVNFGAVWRLVNTTFRLCFARPLEVFNRVGDVDIVAIDARRFERAIEKPARGPDEWTTGAILCVSRLFADDEQ